MSNGSSQQVRKAPRKRSVRLEKEMIAEAGGLCGWCRKPVSLEIHHIDENPGNTVPQNLIAICGACHDEAKKGYPSPADFTARKLQLQWQRTAMLSHSLTAPQKKMVVRIKKAKNPQFAETINNYRGVKPPRANPAVDAIEADAAMKGYVGYLIKRYIWCRIEEQKRGDPRRFHPAMAKNIVEKAVGFAPYGAPQKSFDVVVKRLVALVCRTKWAKQVRYSPHSWERHQAILAGEDDHELQADVDAAENEFATPTPYDELARSAPKQAIVAAWRDVERVALNLVDSKMTRVDRAPIPIPILVPLLVGQCEVDGKHIEILQTLAHVQSRVLAEPDLRFETDDAARCCALAVTLIAYLRSK